jgi:hypothetical protein
MVLKQKIGETRSKWVKPKGLATVKQSEKKAMQMVGVRDLIEAKRLVLVLGE